MNRVIRTKSGHRPNVHWRRLRAPGRGQSTWIQQIGDGTLSSQLETDLAEQSSEVIVGRRRNGPLLSTRDDDEKTATEERNEWEKKRKSAGIGTFPSPPWGGGGAASQVLEKCIRHITYEL